MGIRLNVKMTNCVALIPARQNSKRIPDKNICLLNGHPLIAYTICSALDSNVFDAVVVSTDSENYADTARKYGAEVIIRPQGFSMDSSPDILWVNYTIKKLRESKNYFNYFSILRPTSPFRQVETIQRAWDLFNENKDFIDSIRAIEKCKQHPNKMWLLTGSTMKPLLESGLHNLPYQVLPEVYVQNASLEIAHSYLVILKGTISGDVVMPFFTQEYEGFDINVPYDLKYAEWLIETGQARLPDVRTKS